MPGSVFYSLLSRHTVVILGTLYCFFMIDVKKEERKMTEQIGAKIKEARSAAGMTQKELAEAVGLSAKAISEAERGL